MPCGMPNRPLRSYPVLRDTPSRIATFLESVGLTTSALLGSESASSSAVPGSCNRDAIGHERLPQVLAERFPDAKETQPELLAHHYTEAGLSAHAIPHWREAGQHAMQKSAYAEAHRHFAAALESLASLPATAERVRQELTLQILLGASLQVIRGFAAPEVEQIYTRARELSEQTGASVELAQVLYGLFQLCIIRPKIPAAHEFGEQLLGLSQRAPDLALKPAAYRAVGEALLWLGELPQSRACLEQGISLYDPAQQRSILYGLDPGSATRSFTAMTLWLLGYPDQARERIREAHSMAQESDDLHGLTHALCFAAWISSFRREAHLVHERAAATIALSTEQGFPLHLAIGHIFQGWSLTEQGKEAEGIAQMQQGLTGWSAIGAELCFPCFTALLADGYGKVGRTEEGLALLAEAMDVADKSGARFWNAEVSRLRGELTLQKEFNVQGSTFKVTDTRSLLPDPQGEAEACFLKAIAVARKQQAKSLELRAAMSLAHLWQAQAKPTEARALLAPVYEWFTEGFDTKDLQEAKALLNELT